MEALSQVFTECQHSASSHPKLIKSLVKIYLKSDFNQFLEKFTSRLKCALIYGDKQPAVERTLSFVVKFATAKKVEQGRRDPSSEAAENEEDEADLFLEKLIIFLLKNHEANSPAVRYRICQLLSMLLRHMGAEAAIDNDLYDVIYDTMLHRLQDKIPGVRKEAVMALTRLQDPHNKECPVIKAYRFHLSKDPHYDVRRAVLNNIAVTYQTLPDILERTRDVRELVRCQAYTIISQKIHLKSLTIAQRVRLISEGLKDRNEMVRNCVKKKLIPSWLQMLDGNILDLLTCLDVEASVKEAELVIMTIFQITPFPDLIENIGLMKEERLVNPSTLRPESALYWRCLAQHLKEEGAEGTLDEILPDLTHYCSYLRDFILADVVKGEDEQEAAIHCMEKEFISNQLITMAFLFDLSDEVGRRSLDQLVRTLLVSDKVGESLVKGLVKIFAKLHPLNARINQLAEIISEIREPLSEAAEQCMTEEGERKLKLKVAGLKVKINEVREDLEDSVRNLDIEKTRLLKQKLAELETEVSEASQDSTVTEEHIQEECNDPAILIKCLTIVCNMVECSEVKEMTPTLHSLHEYLILKCLRSEDPAVRNQGVHALGLLCLVSKEMAHQYITLFMQISRIDIEAIQITALHFVFDMLHLYGMEEFTEAAENMIEVTEAISSKKVDDEEESEEDGGAIMSALCQMLDDESMDVRTLAAEGLCKLLVSSRITSSKLLSRLILMFYNPAIGDDSLLRHMLGVFFPLYACEGGSNQESLCEAVLPTLRTLLHAPFHSPLANVDVEDVANFLISITSPAIISQESQEKVNTHDTLVFSLCSEILAQPMGRLTKLYIRSLNRLQLTPTNYSTLRQVEVMSSKLIKLIEGKSTQNLLKRFQQKIEDMLTCAPEAETGEEKPADKTEPEVEEMIDEDAENRTMENTVIRRKRMLFNTHNSSDPAIFSSEDSEIEGSPSKRASLSSSSCNPDSESSVFGSPQITSTQIKPEAVAAPTETKTTVAATADGENGESSSMSVLNEDTEIELTQTDESSLCESDGNNTLQAKVTGDQTTAKQDTPNTTGSDSFVERDETLTSVTSGSCKSRDDTSSEEEATPPKVRHVMRTNKCPRKRNEKSSEFSMSNDAISHPITSKETSPVSRTPRTTRSKCKPASDSSLHSSSGSSSIDGRRASPRFPRRGNTTPSSDSKRKGHTPSNSSQGSLSSTKANLRVMSDETTSESSVLTRVSRTTRSKTKSGSGFQSLSSTSPSTSQTNSQKSPGQNQTTPKGDAPSSSKITSMRTSKRSKTPGNNEELTHKSIRLRSEKLTSVRRSPRVRPSQ